MFDSTDPTETPDASSDPGSIPDQSQVTPSQAEAFPPSVDPVASLPSHMSMAGPNLMMRAMVGVLIALVVVGVVWVWSVPSENGDAVADGPQDANPEEAPDTLASRNPFLSTGSARTTLEGNWVLIISQPDDVERRFDEICSGLFILTPRRGNLDDMTIRIAYRTQVFPDAKLDAAATSADRKHARVVFQQGLQRIDFDGMLLEDGIVYGNVVRGDVCLAARLMPTDEVELDPQIAVMSTLDRPKLDAVVNQAKTKKLTLYDTYRMFCAEHSDTSLALDISLKNLMGHADPSKMPLREFRAAVNEHLKLTKRWGFRMKVVNTLILSHVAFTHGYPPTTAISLTDGLSESLGDHLWGEPFKRRLEELLDRCHGKQGRIEAEDALKQLAAKSTTDRETPLAKLRELRKALPYSHFVTYGLAEEAEKAKRVDEAIQLYGEIVALPLMERLLEFEWESAGFKAIRPGDTLAKLWKAKHGDTKGLAAHLEGVYAAAVQDLAKSTEVTLPKLATRSVLCELFTSVRADASVAAEMSTAALARRLGTDKLIVVRYHPLDVARRNQANGDPLANDASLNRLAYYRGRTIPSIYLDGSRLAGTDGLLADTTRVHRQLVHQTVKRLAQPSDWSMTLAAQRNGPSIQVTASAKSSKPAEGEYRLRMLLVEERVPMPTASCGIRVQEMVVRWQIDGGDGVAPKDGNFTVSETVSIDHVRKQLNDDLARFERLQGMNFPEKPLELKSLFVIALVQDETTREVLQAKLVPVTSAPASN